MTDYGKIKTEIIRDLDDKIIAIQVIKTGNFWEKIKYLWKMKDEIIPIIAGLVEAIKELIKILEKNE